MTTTDRRRVAVIGSGVSGLTAAYVLNGTADVTMFEADDRLGGHAHTHDVSDGAASLAVDSGFIVHNRRTYPLLCRLFDELGIPTQPTRMTMSVSCHGCGLEYCGARGAAGLFARRRNLASPRYLALLAQVPLFHRRARALLADGGDDDRTLRRFVDDGGYTPYFVRHFVVPLVSAVWSCGPGSVLDYPARYLFRFLDHHGMLTVKGSPPWRTVTGGSRTYVDLIAKGPPSVRSLTPVRAVGRHAGGVEVRDESDTVSEFDAVVVAVHADQALRLLTDPTGEERDVLSAFTYSRNDTTLHTDPSVLPRRAGARGGWNYLLPTCAPTGGHAIVSYDMNRLQRLGSGTDYVVTLGGGDRIAPSRVLASMTYRHPIYTPTSLAAQRRLPELNNAVTAYAGAYHGWGFHEDGCRSGVAAARSLGATW